MTLPQPKIVLKNQFGEESENKVLAGTDLTSTVQEAKLTGLVEGSNGPIQATDTVIQALQNLQAQITILQGGTLGGGGGDG